MRARVWGAVALALPLIELVVLIQVGRRLGPGPTVLIVLASSVLGLAVVRRAGRTALRDLAAAGRRGAGPEVITLDETGRPLGSVGAPSGRPAGEQAVIALAGLLLLVPGLLTSVTGLVLLIPGVSSLAGAAAARLLRRRRATTGPSVRVISVEPDPGTARPRHGAATANSAEPAVRELDGGLFAGGAEDGSDEASGSGEPGRRPGRPDPGGAG